MAAGVRLSRAAFASTKIPPTKSCIKRSLSPRVPPYQNFSRRRKWNVALSAAKVAGTNINNDDSSPLRKETFEQKQKQLEDASTLSLAPMMEYTDRHFRHLVRLVSSRTLVYTEMVGASAIYHEAMDAKEAYRQENPHINDPETIKRNYEDKYIQRFVSQGKVPPLEGPSVLQLGGSDPEQMFHAAQTIMELTERGRCDYTAINLNCGCPSPKVAGKGCFGAALMDDPSLVRDVTKGIYDGCEGQLPITVKCRIGTDTDQPFTKQGYAQMDPEEEYRKLCNFIETVASNGVVKSFDIHARIAVLTKSFSPADNRKIPPLKYEVIQRLVQDYPEFSFVLNGGIETIAQTQSLLEQSPGLKGVMIGRAWAADPWRFAMADQLLYKEPGPPVAKNRLEVLKEYGRHADLEETLWDPVKIRRFIVKAVVPLFAGEPNSKKYRVTLDELANIPKKLQKEGKSLESQPPISELIVNTAMDCLSEEVLLRTPEESYERFLWQEQKESNIAGRSQVSEWQTERKRADAAKETGEEEMTDASKSLQQNAAV